jgi:hypothetical protein
MAKTSTHSAAQPITPSSSTTVDGDAQNSTALASPVDPIFAAIEEHKSATMAFVKATHKENELEEMLPSDRTKSRANIHTCDCDIVENDDPQWIEAVQRSAETSDAMDDAARKLVTTKPTSLQGAAAALQYMVDHIDRYDGEAMGFPDEILPDGIDPDTAERNASRTPEFFLMQSVAAALVRLAV